MNQFNGNIIQKSNKLLNISSDEVNNIDISKDNKIDTN